ncbi:hypothetical protein G5B88_08510 [Herbaspirillum seropedicae]|jgi:hypothetical protein|uniref:hypothetical protein n=1 Tax=Herbaspirillum seropedicae TaxID=964 RepID=UPI000863A8EE|nr:hypothetical protein [Herbaspirillum seropedicae]AON54019.1 hypothetical protein Hsc_1719 [Herbaspirillum seropedicae]MDR6394997.1 hypothetical protein [Herbaspirillum seropedicae]QDD64129.1 hypothetical protein EJD96_08135 [Herbaspirillum seropedicae]UMU21217.1 hypothetical protein G5B88_08510 [Herbaspirillum seropedicae]
METDFHTLCRVVEQQHLMLAQMAKLLETDIAIREAHTSILHTLTAIARNDPDFRRLLSEIHTSRLNMHIHTDVDNKFIQTYIDNVNTFLPDQWKYAPMTAEKK